MNTIRFSIATPTRNSLEKLQRCVGSVRGQTGATFEHLIQDAVSSDGTPQWLAKQSDLNSVSESDGGMYDAINRAWGRAQGEFFSWINSDEQYLPGTLQNVAEYFDSHPEVDVVFGNYIVVDQHGLPIALRREIPFRKIYVANSFLNMASATTFFRKNLRSKGLLNLNTKYRYAADKDLILRLASAGVVIRHLPIYLSLFGVDGTNLSTHPQMELEAEDIRIKNGAYRNKLMREILLTGRRIERLFKSGYQSQSVCYRYAVDDVPHYVEIKKSNLGGRYSLDNTEGHADSIVKVTAP